MQSSQGSKDCHRNEWGGGEWPKAWGIGADVSSVADHMIVDLHYVEIYFYSHFHEICENVMLNWAYYYQGHRYNLVLCIAHRVYMHIMYNTGPLHHEQIAMTNPRSWYLATACAMLISTVIFLNGINIPIWQFELPFASGIIVIVWELGL